MQTVPEIAVQQLSKQFDPRRIVDVREDDEWSAGHVRGSRHIRMHDIPGRLGELADGEPTYVICRTGSRSAYVVAFLNAQGCDAVNVAGGLDSWAAAGLPMESSTGAQAFVL